MLVLAAVAAAVPLLLGHADRFIPAISEWYLDVASPHAVKSRRNLIPLSRGDTPFEACVRRAARESARDGTGTVITFNAETESVVTRLAEDLVIILARFEEEFESGARGTSEFHCTARRVEGAWRVESMTVAATDEVGNGERFAVPHSPFAAPYNAVTRGARIRGAATDSEGVKSSPGLTKRSDSQAY